MICKWKDDKAFFGKKIYNSLWSGWRAVLMLKRLLSSVEIFPQVTLYDLKYLNVFKYLIVWNIETLYKRWSGT